jgi:hypothetical protein
LARAFFSDRFSFRLLLDFLLLDWRGDLSDTAGSSGLRTMRTPGHAPCWYVPEPTLTGVAPTVLRWPMPGNHVRAGAPGHRRERDVRATIATQLAALALRIDMARFFISAGLATSAST